MIQRAYFSGVFHLLWFLYLSASSSARVPEQWGEWFREHIPLKLFLSPYCLTVGLRNCSHLLPEEVEEWKFSWIFAPSGCRSSSILYRVKNFIIICQHWQCLLQKNAIHDCSNMFMVILETVEHSLLVLKQKCNIFITFYESQVSNSIFLKKWVFYTVYIYFVSSPNFQLDLLLPTHLTSYFSLP